MARLNRRKFLQHSAAAASFGTLFTISGTKSSGRVIGANDRIRIGLAGLNGRGEAHVNAFAGRDDVEIAYLIDPDSRVFQKRLDQIKKLGGTEPKMLSDVREVLDDQNLDAISIATPNHWHALMTVWACQEGKDVYVEKPCSHNVHEGRQAVEAARKYKRIVQHGTQGRSSREWAGVMEFMKSGAAGKLLVSRALCYKPRNSIDFQQATEAPQALDFNLWLGPAGQQPFHANLVHYNWHWFWDFGNGDIGNQGVHQMDIARWGIDGATLPKSVISLGGRWGYKDQGQTANTQITVFDFDGPQLIFEVRGLKSDEYMGERVGNIFHCEGGDIYNNQFHPKDGGAPVKIPAGQRGPGNSHFDNFLAAMRSRNQSDLNADILEGHYSSALCHLANLSYQLGTATPASPRTTVLSDNPAAMETMERMEKHLVDGHGLKLEETPLTIGRKLMVDAAQESILDDADAVAMLTREYRGEFVVPEQV